MADGHGEGVGGIFLGDLRQVEQYLDHLLHLLLGSLAVADHRLFYLQGGVFEDIETGIDAGNDGGAAGLAELEGTLDIVGEEDVFHGHGIS